MQDLKQVIFDILSDGMTPPQRDQLDNPLTAFPRPDYLKRLAQRIQTLEEENNRLRHQAERDPLTGLRNRAAFTRDLHDCIERAIHPSDTPNSHYLSLVSLDIDHFKYVNDTFGHPAGDIVLEVVARTMERSIRATDRAYRVGGEEFTIILPGANDTTADRISEQIRKNIENTQLRHIKHNITASLGTFCVDFRFFPNYYQTEPLQTDDLHQILYTEADNALYTSKTTGRNRVTLLSDDAVQPVQVI